MLTNNFVASKNFFQKQYSLPTSSNFKINTSCVITLEVEIITA